VLWHGHRGVSGRELSSRVSQVQADGDGMSDESTDISHRIDTLDELELSVHHVIRTNPMRSTKEYESHAGNADEIKIPEKLVEVTKTRTGVDIRIEDIHCGADIQIIQADTVQSE